MTRIISGSVGGRRLATPPGAGTRPTSDRVREALFSRLEHLEVLDGATVLDLYAGSGALALEALSRGAAAALLVDADRTAASVARGNARDLGFARRVQVRAEPAERVLQVAPAEPGQRAGLVFIDPPYELAEDRLADVLALLVGHGWLAPGALVVSNARPDRPSRAGRRGCGRRGSAATARPGCGSLRLPDLTKCPDRLLASPTCRQSASARGRMTR